MESTFFEISAPETNLPYLDPYELLALALWEHQGLPKGKVPRTGKWLWTLREAGNSLQDLFSYLLKPREQNLSQTILEPSQIPSVFVGPILKSFRGTKTMAEVMAILRVKNKETYHYWETGQRDLPLHQFLKIVDKIGNRLQIFCEMIGFKKDLKQFKLKSFKEGFSENFFAKPWTPTVYLLLQSEPYLALARHQSGFLTETLQISEDQLQESLSALADLEMIRFNGTHYVPFKGVFYAPPNLNPQMLSFLNEYWMGRSYSLGSQIGLHKIEQASVSYASRDKIIQWVGELREKIRQEIKTTTPETVIHLHWQVADLIHKNEKGHL